MTVSSLRVGIVSQWYPPEPAPIPRDIARHLAAAGHEVTVLTGLPNYPVGSIYGGYRRTWRKKELIDAIPVTRVAEYASHDGRVLHRFLNYASFAAAGILQSAALRHCDVVYVYCTPITAAFPALIARLFWRVPVVAHVQDLWPESVSESGMVRRRSGVLERAFRLICDSIYRRCNVLVAIAPGMADRLRRRMRGVGKVVTVYNWAPSAAGAVQVSPGTLEREARVTAVYAGNLGSAQDLLRLADAVSLAANDGDGGELRVRLVGDGMLRAALEDRARRVTAIELKSAVPPEAMKEVYDAADFSLVTLRDADVFDGTIPSKLQASLAYGMPVITNIRGDVADILRRYGCGFVAEPGDTESLAAQLQLAARATTQELANMRAAAKRAAAELFDRDVCLTEIAHVLTDAAHGGDGAKR